MWKPIIKCAIIGGIIVYLWYMLTWMVLPMHGMMINKFTNESEVTSCIEHNITRDGIYVVPSMQTLKNQKTTGPQSYIMVNFKRGVEMHNMVKPIICSLISKIIGAGLIAFLLIRSKVNKYWNRVWFVVLISLISSILATLPMWNWWHYPTGWTFMEIFDSLIAWFLAGLAIAKYSKT